MGLESRDYVRDEPRWPGGGFGGGGGGPMGAGDANVTKKIVLFTIVVFVAQMLTIRVGPVREGGLVTAWLKVDWPSLTTGQVWRLVTYAFCHSTVHITHIIFNMLVLWFFGRTVEMLIGSREFLRFYLVAAVVAGLAYVGLGLSLSGFVNPMLGASGAVMAVFAYFALTYPRAKLLLFGIIPVEARWLLVGYVVLDMAPVLRELGGGGHAGHVAHAAHLGGLAFGLWYKWAGVNIGSWFSGFGNWRLPSRRRSNPNVRLFDPTAEPDENLDDERGDALLAKIQQHGESSLTNEEREFLKAWSRKYRRR